MIFFRKILFPFTIIYFLITCFRNILFDLQLLKSRSFDFPLIGVGNLSSGGTGKTPLVEYIFKNFSDSFNLSLLSRGYKRSGSGYVRAGDNSSPSLIGDEPYQIFKKFRNIQVAVDGNRVRGVENLINEIPNLQGVVLDDCFQHRYIDLKLNILLTTYQNPFFKDCILPSGNLRESSAGYHRADVIIVTKCPLSLNSIKMDEFKGSINLKNHQSLFFTSIEYNNTLFGKESIKLDKLKKFKILLVTGIANNTPLLEFLNKQNIEFDHLNFNDHHNYSTNDIEKIKKDYFDRIIITTEKDYIKINQLGLKNDLYYLEIETKFLRDENSFKKIIRNTLSN